LLSKVISGSTKVSDFGTNRKRVFDFLLVINSNLCRISHCFGDSAAYWSKITNSYPPHPHSMPSLGMTPFEFWDEHDISRNQNDRATIWCRNHDRRSNHVDTVHECDRRTDGLTDRQTELRSQRPCNA